MVEEAAAVTKSAEADIKIIPAHQYYGYGTTEHPPNSTYQNDASPAAPMLTQGVTQNPAEGVAGLQ